MAEFLIMAKRHWSYKPNMTEAEQAEYDRQYQVGDIVEVFPDGRLSDHATAGGKFYVVRVDGLDYDTAKKYQEQWNVDDVLHGGKVMFRRRKFRIRVADVPQAVKNALQSTGVYNTTWSAVKSYVRNNLTGMDES